MTEPTIAEIKQNHYIDVHTLTTGGKLNYQDLIIAHNQREILLKQLEAAEQTIKDIKMICNNSDDYTKEGIVGRIDEAMLEDR